VKALEWVDLALARNPQNLELTVVKASRLSALGRLEEAEESLFHVFELRPDDWVVQFLKGYYLAGQDRPEEAVESYDQTLRLFDTEYAAENYDHAAMVTYRGYTHLEHVIYQKKLRRWRKRRPKPRTSASSGPRNNKVPR
jgi:tetratricopeptide (TPR) repeat protein